MGVIADLGELDGSHLEIGLDTESSESENESGGKKSGVHRGDPFEALRTGERGEGSRPLRRSTLYRGRQKTENGPSLELTKVHFGSTTIRFLTVLGSNIT